MRRRCASTAQPRRPPADLRPSPLGERAIRESVLFSDRRVAAISFGSRARPHSRRGPPMRRIAVVVALGMAGHALPRPGRRQFQAGGNQCLGRGVPARRRRRPRAGTHQGAGRQQGEAQLLERPQARHGKTGRRVLDRDHAGAGAGAALLRDQCRRPRCQRSRQPGLLRRLALHQHGRDPRARVDLLLHPGRAARPGARDLVQLRGHRLLAACAGLSTARLRHLAQDPLPGALPAARRR